MRSISIITLFIFILTGQNKQSDYSIGKTHTIKSKILDQEREIYIYLPESYEISNKTYPVLYVLDGHWHFTTAVGIQKSLRTPDIIPEMVIVGIKNKNPLRHSLFWSKKDIFIDFLEKELIQFVETSFRTNTDRVLFGWESAAMFTGYAMFEKRQLFNAGIMTNGAYAYEKMVDDYLKRNTEKKLFLHLAGSQKDIYSFDWVNEFIEMMKSKKPKNIDWSYKFHNDETHESLPYIALYKGLTKYYHNYGSLNIGSIKEFESLGGLEYLKRYFNSRGKRFGYSTEIDKSTKDALIWLAWKRDNFKYFKLFMEEFKDVLSTKRYASSYWQNRFGQYYLKYKKYDKAIEYFMNGLNKYDKTAEIYHGLGNAYLGKKLKSKTREYFKKAVEVAKEKSDQKLSTYQKSLANMN